MKVSQLELITGANQGKVISFPTDTVPALAVKPELSQLIFALKQRPAHKPLILMGSSFEAFLPYLRFTAPELAIWQQIAAKYLPGALTLVLPASELVPAAMNPTASQTIGVRIPQLQIAQEILTQTGVLATTSANLSGQPPLRTIAAIDAAFPSVLTLNAPHLTLQQEQGSGTPSTVAKWTGADWEILRQGKIFLPSTDNE